MHYAIHSAETVSMVLAQSVGRIVQMSSEMTARSATNLNLMEEEQVQFTNVMIVRNGAHSGTQSAELTSTTLRAAYVHLIAHLV